MKKSFTLIEILVVVFIIALIAGIAIVIFNRGDFAAKQRDGQRAKDMNELAAAIEEFKADHGHYPFINWGPGFHAWEAVTGYGFNATDCNGTYGGDYTAWQDKHNHDEFNPGTEIKRHNGIGCDDLSLQLLGLAYLPKMPFSTPVHPAFDAPLWNYKPSSGEGSLSMWQTTSLKRYIDEIPVDPDPNIGIPAADGTNWNPYYFYNSYYDCACENVHYGDRYWLQAMVEKEKGGNGEGSGIEEGLYFYEMGNLNWNRQPQSKCGC